MKKQIITILVAILIIVGGCNNQAIKQTDHPYEKDNLINIQKQVEDTNQNGQVDNEEINNTNETSNTAEKEGSSKNQGIKNEIDNPLNDNSPIDCTDSSSNVPEEQVYLIHYNSPSMSRTMVNLTNFPNGKLNSISYQDFINKYFTDKELLAEIAKEGYDVTMTPSSEYLIMNLPIQYTKYLNYDIVSFAKKKFPNFETHLNSSHGFDTGPVYSVVYSIKQQKIVFLDEVKNDSDKASIYGWILDPYYFYVSSLNTIKLIDYKGDYDYLQNICVWQVKNTHFGSQFIHNPASRLY